MAEKTYDLSTFRLERILSKNSKTKMICVLGTFPSQESPDSGNTEPAIILLEKTAFTDHDVNTTHNNGDDVDDDDDGTATQRNTYFSLQTQLQKEFINDIYGNFLCFPLPAINSKFFHHLLLFCTLFLLLLLIYAFHSFALQHIHTPVVVIVQPLIAERIHHTLFTLLIWFNCLSFQVSNWISFARAPKNTFKSTQHKTFASSLKHPNSIIPSPNHGYNSNANNSPWT